MTAVMASSEDARIISSFGVCSHVNRINFNLKIFKKFLPKLNSCSLETLTYLFLCIFSPFDLFPTNLPGKGQDRKGFMFLSSFEFFELFDIVCEWKNHWNALWAFDSALNWVSTEDCQNVNYQVSSCVGDRGPNLNKTDEKYWQIIKQITK